MSVTKEKILDAAEKCFAKEGLGASVRRITTEANVNLGAITYHFGSKDNLVSEVFLRRIQEVNVERFRRLDQIEHEASDDRVTIERVLEAFISPMFAMVKKNPDFIQFQCKLLQQGPIACREKIHEILREVTDRFVSAFSRVLPDYSHAEVVVRYFMSLTLAVNMINFFRNIYDMWPHEGGEKMNYEEVHQILLAFLQGGIERAVKR